ncbi:MAG: hypothetical protein GX815_04255 [Clostridiales bacterium]|nr:hypothetical protein [Clostridiales bacterium]
MMKRIGLLVLFIFVLILSGCNAFKTKIIDNGVNPVIPSASENSVNTERTKKTLPRPNLGKLEGEPIAPPDLGTEEGIREYLAGEWIFDKEYVSDIVVTMNIDKDLNVYLSFNNSYTEESKAEYIGKIEFDRVYANSSEAPDLLCLELMNTDDPGGDFFFLHRTTYDEKFVMSWFFAANGNCVFDMLSTEEFGHAPEEIMFEKVSGKTSQLEPHVDTEFHGVFWGKGVDGKSLWINEVHWWMDEEDDFERGYPRRMALYENDLPESILYSIAPDRISEILGEDFFPGEVYSIRTDDQGKIVDFIGLEYKAFLGGGFDDAEPETGDVKLYALIFDIIENDIEEIQEYLNAGMSILIDGETVTIDDEDCFYIILGTNHEEHFVQEIFYAVNIFTRQIYRYDFITDTWYSLVD